MKWLIRISFLVLPSFKAEGFMDLELENEAHEVPGVPKMNQVCLPLCTQHTATSSKVGPTTYLIYGVFPEFHKSCFELILNGVCFVTDVL